MSERFLEGGCQCGAVRYRISGSPVMAALCHCSMCRRASAAPVVAWAMYQQAQALLTGESPSIYESSPGCSRGFCGRCGTQISFTADAWRPSFARAAAPTCGPHRPDRRSAGAESFRG